MLVEVADLRGNVNGVRRDHWCRFSMRTTLAVVTLATIASWLYWDGWPRYSFYRDRMKFEAMLTQVAGDMENTEATISSNGAETFTMWDDDGGYVACKWRGIAYFLYFPKTGSRHSVHAIEIYRLAYPPANYSVKQRPGYMFGPGNTAKMTRELYYWDDFHDFLLGKRQKKPVMEFELFRVVPRRHRIKVQPPE